MIKIFRISYQVRITCRINSMIYFLKKLPFVGRLIPEVLYGGMKLKKIAGVFSFLWEFLSSFLGKAMYLGLMVFLPMLLYPESIERADLWFHILLFLTMIGAFMNTWVFNPTNDKYYLIILMRLNARDYTLSNYLYVSVQMLVSFLPFLLLFGEEAGASVICSVLFLGFLISIKLTAVAVYLKKYLKTGAVTNENNLNRTLWILAFILLAAAYGLPAFGILLPEAAVFVFAVFMVPAGLYSIRTIWEFPYYREMYQQILSVKRYGADMTDQIRQASKIQNEKYISQNVEIHSEKKGFEAFHELFVLRHRKILWKPIIRTTILCLGIVLAVLIGMKISKTFGENVGNMLATRFPFFGFVMYLTNRGGIYTRVLFMNCDHSMLTYPFYKKPSFILRLFQIRLRELVKLNLPPALVIAAGLVLCMSASGSVRNASEYVIVFAAVLAMNVFFSVHYLACYYLFQPYNAYTDMKGVNYQIVTSATYFLCLLLMRIKLERTVFGLLVILFCFLYCAAACILVYRFAVQTFRLRT